MDNNTPKVTINGKTYVLCDFKTNFTFLQFAKASELVKEIFTGSDTSNLFSHLALIGSDKIKGQENGLVAAILQDLTGLGDVFAKQEFVQLFFTFFLPEGVKWSREYSDTLQARAEANKYDVPFWEVIEAIKGFFTSKTTASENSLSISPVQDQPPQSAS